MNKGDVQMRTCVLVAGMHRSGTSAMSRVLNLLGCDLSGNLIPPKENDNPSGFWEPRAVVDVNKAIDASLGFFWNDVRAVPTVWYESAEKAEMLDRAVAALESDFFGSTMFSIKDPRVCRTLPLWLEALHRLNIQPIVVITLRHPDAVAASIATRNGIPPICTHMSWLRHVLAAEADSRDCRRVVLEYDDLITDWRSTIARIANQTRLNWSSDLDTVSAEIDTYLDPGQRHHAEPTASQLPDWVADVYAIMRRFAHDGNVRGDTVTLDAIGADFDRAMPLVGDLANCGTELARRIAVNNRTAASTAKKAGNEIIVQRDKFKRRAESAQKELADARSALAVAQNDLQAIKAQIKVSKSEVKLLTETLLDSHSGMRDAEDVPFKAVLRIARAAFHRMMRCMRLRKEIKTLEQSDLFDADWYVETYPDVSHSGVRPSAHYLMIGAPALRNPSPRFNTAQYLNDNPRLKRTQANPLVHYIKHN